MNQDKWDVITLMVITAAFVSVPVWLIYLLIS